MDNDQGVQWLRKEIDIPVVASDFEVKRGKEIDLFLYEYF